MPETVVTVVDARNLDVVFAELLLRYGRAPGLGGAAAATVVTAARSRGAAFGGIRQHVCHHDEGQTDCKSLVTEG